MNPNILTSFLWSDNNLDSIINSPLWVWLCRPDGFHTNISSMEEKLLKWIRRMNMTALAYKVNTPQNLEKAIQLGIDGIFTDDPYLSRD